MGILLGATGASVFIYEKVLVPVLGNYPGSLAYALLYVLFCWYTYIFFALSKRVAKILHSFQSGVLNGVKKP
jgi:predicted acyltransferase